jgi:membrane-bound metal-dependent hydrolase YbcI (DUF457 family)
VNAGPHFAIGAACGLALSGALPVEPVPTIALCALAALLPDLDHHSSLATSWLRSGLTLVALAAAVLAATHTDAIARYSAGASALVLLAELLPSVSPSQQLLLVGLVVGVLVFAVVSLVGGRLEPWHWVEHRGPLHAPILVPLVGLLGALLLASPSLGLVVAAGWATHLLTDAPTYRGLPLLWPYSRRMLHVTPAVLRWRSGTGWIEWPIALICLLLGSRLAGL